MRKDDYAPAAARSDNPEVRGERTEAPPVADKARRASEKTRSIATYGSNATMFSSGQ